MEIKAPRGFRGRPFQIERQKIFAYVHLHYLCPRSHPSTHSVGLMFWRRFVGGLGGQHGEQGGDGAAAMTERELGFEVEFGHGAVQGWEIEERVVAEAAGAAGRIGDESLVRAPGGLLR